MLTLVQIVGFDTWTYQQLCDGTDNVDYHLVRPQRQYFCSTLTTLPR